MCTVKPLVWLIKGQNLHKHQSKFAFTNFSVGFLNCFVCVCKFRVCAFVRVSACAYCISGLSTSVCLISNYCLWCPSAAPPPPCPAHTYSARLHITSRLEPEILLRAKQDFMKIDSAADLEWVRFTPVCMLWCSVHLFFCWCVLFC